MLGAGDTTQATASSSINALSIFLALLLPFFLQVLLLSLPWSLLVVVVAAAASVLAVFYTKFTFAAKVLVSEAIRALKFGGLGSG